MPRGSAHPHAEEYRRFAGTGAAGTSPLAADDDAVVRIAARRRPRAYETER